MSIIGSTADLAVPGGTVALFRHTKGMAATRRRICRGPLIAVIAFGSRSADPSH